MSHSKCSEHFQFLFKGKQAPSLQELPRGGKGWLKDLRLSCQGSLSSLFLAIYARNDSLARRRNPAPLHPRPALPHTPLSNLHATHSSRRHPPGQSQLLHPDHPQPTGAVIFFFSPLKNKELLFYSPPSEQKIQSY